MESKTTQSKIANEANRNSISSLKKKCSLASNSAMWQQLAAALLSVLFCAVILTTAASAGSPGFESALSSSTQTVGQANDTMSVTADDALAEHEQAQSFLTELEELDEDSLVSVKQSTTESIENRIENGNLSFSRANYASAHEHFEVASEQAQAALGEHYADGKARYLNATASYLSDREAAGYTPPEAAAFEEQIQQFRSQEADDLGEYRQQYQEAKRLNNEVKSSLPSMTVVNLANLLSPLWVTVLIGIGGLVLVGALSGFLGYSLAGSDGDQGGTEVEQVTTSQFNND